MGIFDEDLMNVEMNCVYYYPYLNWHMRFTRDMPRDLVLYSPLYISLSGPSKAPMWLYPFLCSSPGQLAPSQVYTLAHENQNDGREQESWSFTGISGRRQFGRGSWVKRIAAQERPSASQEPPCSLARAVHGICICLGPSHRQASKQAMSGADRIHSTKVPAG
ncbi:hypothetical protein GQ53DRAFT_377078 [Thozetella sp. PMI_491]|nr:hypothetical protein GQ53DRAFT_377078 [Thozetella sp. PMI_491]